MDPIAFYQSVADNIGPETGASDTLVHVHAGMAVLLLARIVSRRSLATWIPFSFVLAAAVANEFFDYLYQGDIRPKDAALDLINTIFWPLILMIGLRVRRAREMKGAAEPSN